MLITDQQYQQLMKAYNSSGVQAHAAMKAGIDPKTARRYIRAGQGPQDLKTAHTWRTRTDPPRVLLLSLRLFRSAESFSLSLRFMFGWQRLALFRSIGRRSPCSFFCASKTSIEGCRY